MPPIAQDNQPAPPAAPANPPARPSFADAYDVELDLPDEETPAAAASPSAAAAPADPPPETPAAPAPAKPRHPEPLMRLAAQAGLQPDEANALSREELREYAMTVRLERLMLAGNPQNTAPPPAEPADESDDGLNDDDYSPGLVKVIRKMRADHAEELAAIKGELTQIRHAHRAQQFEGFANQFDGWIGELVQREPDYAELLGKGNRRQIRRGSEPMRNRQELLVHMDALAQTYRRLGREVDERELFDLAVQGLFAGKKRPAAPAPPAAADGDEDLPGEPAAEPPARRTPTPEFLRRQEMYREGAVARPTQRNGSEPKGTERARVAVRERLRENGQTEQDRALADGFPD